MRTSEDCVLHGGNISQHCLRAGFSDRLAHSMIDLDETCPSFTIEVVVRESTSYVNPYRAIEARECEIGASPAVLNPPIPNRHVFPKLVTDKHGNGASLVLLWLFWPHARYRSDTKHAISRSFSQSLNSVQDLEHARWTWSHTTKLTWQRRP